MIFHSLDFLAFFLLVVVVYWTLPHRGQNALLLVASYVFYGYIHHWFLVLIATSTLIDYAAARGIEGRPAWRKPLLWASMGTNLGMLAFFKYFNFFADNVHGVLASAGWSVNPPMLRILLPAGISFYTFQAMSYTLDVYRGHTHARRSLLDVATFVSFFPHLVAGPIMRAGTLLTQIERPRHFDTTAAYAGLVKICWGFFKKLVIADNVGIVANKVFTLSNPSFPILWVGVFAFAMQIYADFSAYIDIARGTARWLGVELTENFDHPYMASGPSDFWHRWNITLSTWFRDYVYIPLGGSHTTVLKWARNVLVTFLLSGLWHGASWNYVLWGLYHGVLLVTAGILPRARHSLSWELGVAKLSVRVVRIAGMFVLTCIGWLLFRETDLSMLVRHLTLSPFSATAADRQIALYLFLLTLAYSSPLWIQSIWVEWRRGRPAVQRAPLSWRRVALQGVGCGLAFAAILVLRSRTSLDFIYFQF